MRSPFAVQHHNHKVTLLRTNAGVVVRYLKKDRLVSEKTIDDVPFHVLLDRAYNWVHEQDWPAPADLVHLKEL